MRNGRKSEVNKDAGSRTATVCAAVAVSLQIIDKSVGRVQSVLGVIIDQLNFCR